MAKKIIGCDRLSLYHINPLLASGFYLLRAYALVELKEKNEEWKTNDPIFLTLIMFIAESLVGVFDLIEIYRNKRQRKFQGRKPTMTRYSKNRIEVIQNEKFKKLKTMQNMLMIFGIAVIEFICFYGLQYFSTYPGGADLQTNIRTFKLLSDSFLCYLVLRYQIYRHHFISIFLLILGITLVTVEDIIRGKFDWFLIFVFFGHSILISMRDCWEKWIIENKFISAVHILTYRGIFGTAISFVLGVIYNWSFDPETTTSIFESFYNIFGSGNGVMIWWFIAYFFCCTFYNFFYSLTKQYFNPAHCVVSDSFSTIMWMVILNVLPGQSAKRTWPLLLFGYILVVFGCLLYNDIIILYFCGLERNTKYEVTRRGRKEEMISVEMINMDIVDVYEEENRSEMDAANRENDVDVGNEWEENREDDMHGNEVL